VTSGAAAAVLQTSTIAAAANVSRIMAAGKYYFVIALWSAKEAESAAHGESWV
jgi:hypothetical protein